MCGCSAADALTLLYSKVGRLWMVACLLDCFACLPGWLTVVVVWCDEVESGVELNPESMRVREYRKKDAIVRRGKEKVMSVGRSVGRTG